MRHAILVILFFSLTTGATVSAQRTNNGERIPLAIDYRGSVVKIAHFQVAPGKSSKVVPMSAYRDKVSGRMLEYLSPSDNPYGGLFEIVVASNRPR